MSDGNQTWRTPDWLFQLCEDLIGKRFKLDAAASKLNAKCKRFYTEKENGLIQPWVDGTFCNPGFSIFGLWIKRAVEEMHRVKGNACLIGPKGCSQLWFHRYAKLGRIYAPDQRIAFNHHTTGEPTQTAREDSMVYLIGQEFRNNNKLIFDLRPLAVAERRRVAEAA